MRAAHDEQCSPSVNRREEIVRRLVAAALAALVAVTTLGASPAGASDWDVLPRDVLIAAAKLSWTPPTSASAVDAREVLERTRGRAGGELQPQEACFGEEHADPFDTATMDVVVYGAGLDCDYGLWVLYSETADEWSDSDLDGVVWSFDTDADPASGCGGFEWLALGWWDSTYGLAAGLYYTPSCDVSAMQFVDSAEAVRLSTADIGLVFSAYPTSVPETLRWGGSLKSYWNTSSDYMPNSGFHESAVVGGSPCPTTSQSHFVLTSQPDAAATALRLAGASEVRKKDYGIVSFEADAALARTALAAAGLSIAIYPDFSLTSFDSPNDPGYATQWPLEAVQAPQARDSIPPTADVAIAVIDSGVDATHPDLRGALLPGFDATHGIILGSGNHDVDGHGTAVAGVVAAITNNGSSLASLGGGLSILPIRYDSRASTAVVAIRHATDRGARVINASWGSPCEAAPIADAVAYAQSRGVLVVAATGNEGTEQLNYPAAYPGVLGVGATGFDGTIAPYSTTGAAVDLVAPGGSGDGDPSHDVPVLRSGGGTETVVGTSFAAPLVAGAAGLLLAGNSSLDATTVAATLLSTAVDQGAAGHDSVFGAGVLNAAAAAAQVKENTPEPVARFWGGDRFDTAVSVSRGSYPAAGSAGAVVLARADNYPDALAGAPLASSKAAPLLLTPSATLDARTEAEISRVLAGGRTVYVLGGEFAIAAPVASRLQQVGYHVVRLGGADRFETAIRIAEATNGAPEAIFLATGRDFPDALVAGTTARAARGVVVLTDDGTLPAATANYLAAHPVQRYVVGERARPADPGAPAFGGSTPSEVSAAVARHFFPAPRGVAVASAANFPDALGGGAQASQLGIPLLLTPPDGLAEPAASYIAGVAASARGGILYGGTLALSAAVADQVRAALS